MGSRSRTRCRIFPATTPSEDVIKIVFRYFKRPRLLGNCMLVCKLWRDILSRDDYIGRCLWLHQYPALCKAGTSLTDFTKQYVRLILEAGEPSPRPRLSLSDLEFYLDIWSDDFEDQRLIFSQVIPLNTLLVGLWSPPPGLHIPDPLVLRHLQNRYMRMFTLVEPRLTMRRPRSIKISLLVRQKESGKVACLIRKSASHHVQTGASIAVASDDLCLSPNHPFVPPIRAWMTMLLIEKGQGMIEVFGIDFGFCYANKRIVDPDLARRRMYFWPQNGNISLDEECVLKLLDMLQWK